MSNAAFEMTLQSNSLEIMPLNIDDSVTDRVVRKPPEIEFKLHSAPSKERDAAERFIAGRFHTAFGANIAEFFPLLLSRSDTGKLASVIGIRPGTVRPLFLEQYLEESLEEAISQASGKKIARESLVEIGNLASRCKSGNQLMFTLLTAVLAKAGYTWVVFTATEQIRLLLRRLRFKPMTLCTANPAKLVNRNQQWGDYYQSQPKVQAGNIKEALEILRLNPFTARLIDENTWEIDRLAKVLMAARIDSADRTDTQ